MLEDIGTSFSLIERLKCRNDELAWEQFSLVYEPFLHHWVRRSGVPAADVPDVVQATLLAVYSAIPQLEYRRGYRGGFRGYLLKAVRSKVADYWRGRRRHAPHLPLIENADADAAQDNPLAEQWDREYMGYFLEKSLEAVHPTVSDETWQLFLSYVKEGKTAEDCADQFGITPQAVHSRVWRVVEKLREHVLRIDPDLWPDM